MDPKSKEFKKLQAKWYKKLSDEGFEDIEQHDAHENLKVWHSHYFKKQYNADSFKAKEDYYRIAGEFLHTYPFKSNLEREIWNLHCEGLSMTIISKVLVAKRYKHARSSRTVHKIITYLAKEMIIKKK